MNRCNSFRLLALILIFPVTAASMELTGRFSVLGNAAFPQPGDYGYSVTGSDPLFADQQSLRLMADDAGDRSEWSIHARSSRRNFIRYPAIGLHSSELFRYRELAGNWIDRSGNQRRTVAGYEIDRLFYKHRMESMTISIGRQAVDWGSGRFWQPLNVFGAFAPTDLDTDYKPGIDAAVVDWYPTSFSSLSMVAVSRPDNQPQLKYSGAVHYRRQAGESMELALLASSVIGHTVIGGSLESDWEGIGWRLEARFDDKDSSYFWIAGVDYQFEDSTLISAELFNNSAGAVAEQDLASRAVDFQVAYGLQQQLGRNLVGIALSRELTPLLQGSYSLLMSDLKNRSGSLVLSHLHQASLTYSVSNESDLLFSVIVAGGKGLSPTGMLQSEFGHLPASAMLRYRLYF